MINRYCSILSKIHLIHHAQQFRMLRVSKIYNNRKQLANCTKIDLIISFQASIYIINIH